MWKIWTKNNFCNSSSQLIKNGDSQMGTVEKTDQWGINELLLLVFKRGV